MKKLSLLIILTAFALIACVVTPDPDPYPYNTYYYNPPIDPVVRECARANCSIIHHQCMDRCAVRNERCAETAYNNADMPCAYVGNINCPAECINLYNSCFNNCGGVVDITCINCE